MMRAVIYIVWLSILRCRELTGAMLTEQAAAVLHKMAAKRGPSFAAQGTGAAVSCRAHENSELARRAERSVGSVRDG